MARLLAFQAINDAELYSGSELAKILKTSRRTIAAWRAIGKLPSVTLSKRCVRYLGRDVRALIERGATGVSS